jgi:SNARE protein 1
MRSRNEVEFLRLLKKCQQIADQRSWRLERYVDTLSDYLEKLRNQNVNHLSRDTLEEYGRKVQYLRGIIETEKLPSAEKRLLAAELLAPDADSKASHLITKNKYHEQMRQELLLSNCYRSSAMKLGGGGHEIRNSRNDKAMMEQESNVNEEITQNLLELTNNIRENMQAAQAIIQKDNETLAKVASSADGVGLKMQKNTDKLSEFVRKGCQCGIWVALLLVTCTFLMMVVFIRLFPKQPRG